MVDPEERRCRESRPAEIADPPTPRHRRTGRSAGGPRGDARHAARAPRGPERLLRLHPRRQGREPRVRARPRDRDHRPVGMRQVDAWSAASIACTRRSRGPGRTGRVLSTTSTFTPRGRRRRGAPAGRHGLPEAEPVPDDVDLRQRRRRPPVHRHRPRRDHRPRRTRPSRAPGSGTRSRTGCPARG